MMLKCLKSIWWPTSATPMPILVWSYGPNFRTLTPNLSPNLTKFEPKLSLFGPQNHISWCQTVSYHPYGSNEWC
jgi:hypothetical protein